MSEKEGKERDVRKRYEREKEGGRNMSKEIVRKGMRERGQWGKRERMSEGKKEGIDLWCEGEVT